MADISIITATFNAEATVQDCLSSVQNQQDVSVEHIIIDGGSRNRTVNVVRSNGQVSRLISEPDDGIYDAMNKGIGLATGEIVGILNADDFYTGEDTLMRFPTWSSESSLTWEPEDVDDLMDNLKDERKSEVLTSSSACNTSNTYITNETNGG